MDNGCVETDACVISCSHIAVRRSRGLLLCMYEMTFVSASFQSGSQLDEG